MGGLKNSCCRLQAKACARSTNVLVSLFKLAQKKVWLGELTVPSWPLDFGRKAIKQNKQTKHINGLISPLLLDRSFSNFQQNINGMFVIKLRLSCFEKSLKKCESKIQIYSKIKVQYFRRDQTFSRQCILRCCCCIYL